MPTTAIGPPEKRANTMRKNYVSLLLVTGAMLLILSCESPTSYTMYRNNLVRGRELMKRGEFEEARTFFVRASEIERLPESLAYAASASYKIGDLPAAEHYIREADRQGGKGFSELRIDGYKALILLKGGNQSDGLKALHDYVKFYSYLRPLTNIWEVEAMVTKQRVDIARLEAMLDEQITRYEDEVEQFQRSRTGYYDG